MNVAFNADRRSNFIQFRETIKLNRFSVNAAQALVGLASSNLPS